MIIDHHLIVYFRIFLVSLYSQAKSSLQQAWDNGAIAIFHGVPDAKTAHIFQMNQATRSKNAPNQRHIPMKFRAKFGNFFKPRHKVLEMQSKLNNEVIGV